VSWWPPQAWFTYTRSQLNQIIANQAKEATVMSKLSDAVAQVQADVAKNQMDVQAVLALLTQDNPDVDAAVTALQVIDASMQQTNQSLEAAAGTPAPTTTPPPAA
jgi:hypothetical protein